MKNLFKVTWENFKRLMVLFGFEIIMSAVLISIGVAFVAATQEVGPDQYLTGYEFTYAQLVLTTGLLLASARLFAERFWGEVDETDKQEETPTPAPEPAQPTPEEAKT